MKGTLSDAQSNFFCLSLAHSLAQGRSFELNIEQDIAAVGTYVIEFITGDDEVQMPIFNIVTLSTHSHIDLFSGGDYSGGGPLSLLNLNLPLTGADSPLISINGGVTIDTPGAIIREKHLLGSGQGQRRDIASGGSKIGMIFAPNSQYSITITNDDAGNQDFDIEILFVKL